MLFSPAPFFKTPLYWLALPVAFLIGSLSALSMAPTHYWPLLLCGLAFLYCSQYYAVKARHAFYFGWLFGFGYFVFSLYWIGNALLVEGNDYKWAWPLAVTGLPAILAFYPALACYAVRKFFISCAIRNFVAFITFMLLAEWLRGHLFTGFPWNLFGYMWGHSLAMLQIVHIADIYLLSGLTLLWGASLALPFTPAPKKFIATVLTVSILSSIGCYAYGYQRLENAPIQPQQEANVTFKIVQPNVDQKEKWNMKLIHQHFIRTLDISAPDGNELDTTIIVWPETAISQYILNNNNYTALLKDLLASYSGEVYLVTGVLLSDRESLTNSIQIYNKAGEVTGRYDKSHLVPFGEYMPFRDWIPLKTITNFSGFDKGNGITTLPVTQSINISPLVCYEIIFPSNVVLHKSNSDVIINVTNDAWYGISAGPHQHLLKARLRAIEEGIPVVRSANTGISAFIDPYGRILSKTELYQTELINKNYHIN